MSFSESVKVPSLERRIVRLEDTIRVLLTQNHLGEKLPYAEYRKLWDALPPSAEMTDRAETPE